MSLIKANGAGDQSTGFYNGVATQSLRFDDGSSAYLSRTPSSASNRKTWTWSGWVKRGNITLSASQMLFTARTVGNGTYTLLFFEGSTDYLYLLDNNCTLRTSSVYRDASSWYHIVLAVDTTQATDSNRLKLYVNGTQITDFVTATYPSQNTDLNVNSTATHFIGKQENQQYLDGYLAEVNLVDGLSFFSDTSGTPNTSFNINSFGELKKGVWIAKRYTGSYGTNGFRLQFNKTGTGTGSTTTVGADTANSNHFDSSGIDAEDCDIPDSPENNFCTWNPLSNTGVTLSEGNLQTSGGAFNVCGGTMAVTSGKWYWECKLKSTVDGTHPVIYGFVSANTIAHANNFEQGVYFYTDNGTNKNIVHIENNSVTQTITVPAAMLPIAVNEVMQYAYDGDTGKIWFGKENVWADNSGGTTGNPSTGANPTFTLADTSIFMTPLRDHGGVAWTGLANFGQLDNDYTAPTDFNPLSTANLPEPTISPNAGDGEQADDYFNTVLYQGNGYPTTNGQTIDGVGFKSDFTWIKDRDRTGYNHYLFDSIRGATKKLMSNVSNKEGTEGTSLTSWNIDGFVLGANNEVNYENDDFVSWNWKLGGAPTTTNSAGAGAIPTAGSVKIDGVNKSDALAGSLPATKISASTTAGVSIVTYTGTGSSATIGHGLGSSPEVTIIKKRITAENWYYQSEIQLGAWTNNLRLDTTQYGLTSSTLVTGVSDTTVTVSTSTAVNGSGTTYIMYCFHSVEGYSKIGSFTGGGSNFPFVYTGFRPAFVMFKNVSATAAWIMQDTTRDPHNAATLALVANENYSESTVAARPLDFVSNGFKLRTSATDTNGSGNTIIYMAFAENPFKYANAR
jgi:hypothetical protein